MDATEQGQAAEVLRASVHKKEFYENKRWKFEQMVGKKLLPAGKDYASAWEGAKKSAGIGKGTRHVKQARGGKAHPPSGSWNTGFCSTP